MEIGVSTSPAHIMMTRKRNTWYTTRDGNWNDPNIWMSNSLDRHNITVPQQGDDVHINHTINLNTTPTLTINNLFISGKLTASNNNQTLIVNGDLQATGFIDFTGSNVTLGLNGIVNSIISANFKAGNSTINFGAPYNDQPVLNLSYNNLSTSGSNGIKYMVSDLTIPGNFSPQNNFECGIYNLTVYGTTTLGVTGFPGKFTKNSSTGSLLFIGNCDVEGTVDLSDGNPNIEFRSGLNIHTFIFITGGGTYTFSTNNQTISCSAYLSGNWDASIIISGAITVTLTGGTLQTNSTINGTAPDSTFNNNGVLWIGYNHIPMTTGIFNYQNTTSSTLGYVFNGNYTLPYASYTNLYIGSSNGIKSLSGSTIINSSLVIGSGTTLGSILDCAGFDLDVKGSFTCYDAFLASSFCNVTFGGPARFDHGGNSGTVVDLRSGNPNIEFRAGLTFSVYTVYTGTGIFKFTTANQTVDFSIINNGTLTCNWLVSGAITITHLHGGVAMPPLAGTINGDNTSSTFDCRGTITYNNATAPMATGKLYCNQTANTFIYGASGNQDVQIPSDLISGYQNLTLNGSGAKKLLGNISVKGTYTITSPATLDSNGFSLTNP